METKEIGLIVKITLKFTSKVREPKSAYDSEREFLILIADILRPDMMPNMLRKAVYNVILLNSLVRPLEEKELKEWELENSDFVFTDSKVGKSDRIYIVQEPVQIDDEDLPIIKKYLTDSTLANLIAFAPVEFREKG